MDLGYQMFKFAEPGVAILLLGQQKIQATQKPPKLTTTEVTPTSHESIPRIIG